MGKQFGVKCGLDSKFVGNGKASNESELVTQSCSMAIAIDDGGETFVCVCFVATRFCWIFYLKNQINRCQALLCVSETVCCQLPHFVFRFIDFAFAFACRFCFKSLERFANWMDFIFSSQ